MQKADWTRLCFTLSKSSCLRAFHLTSVAKVEIMIDQKPANSKYKGKAANTGDIRKFVWTDRNGGRSTSGEMISVQSSGECRELSLFASQKSSEATLYKEAKFLSILNIILTSQQCEQQLQWINKNPNTDCWQSNRSAQVDTPYFTQFISPPPQNMSGFSNVTRLTACLHSVTVPKIAR